MLFVTGWSSFFYSLLYRYKSAIAVALAILIITQSSVAPASAQLPDPVDDILGQIAGDAVGPLIKEFQDAGDELVNRAGDNGTMVAVQAGNQMNVLAANANFLLGAQADKLVRNLSADQQNFLASIEAQRRALQTGTLDQTWLLKNVTIVDLQDLVSRIPLVTPETLFLQAMAGAVQLQQIGDYHLILVGSHMGFLSNDDKTTYALNINGSPVQITAQADQKNQESIYIPNASLAPYFVAGKRVYLKTEITIHHEQHKPGNLFRRARTIIEDLHVPFRLVLFSSVAGTFKLVYHTPHYDWIAEPGLKLYTGQQSDDRHNQGNNPWIHTDTWSLGGSGHSNPTEDTEEYTGWSIHQCNPTHDFGVCRFIAGSGCEIQDDSRTLSCTTRANSWPLTLIYGASVSRYQSTGVDDISPGQAYSVNYGQPLQFTVPHLASLIEITGETSMQTNIDVIYPSPQDIFLTPVRNQSGSIDNVVWNIGRPDDGLTGATLVRQ